MKAHEAHDDAQEWLGEEFDPAYFDIEHVNAMLGLDIEDFLPSSPVYEGTELAAMSESGLLDSLAENGDRVPRNLIDECARRGDAIWMNWSLCCKPGLTGMRQTMRPGGCRCMR
ncbi:hypothetical protein [Thiohalophilus sp.]|uniref:hypothetical protein n=1 Tax=Thiohalophilus sp. TaxID=3028392 RepID=UPI002ACE2597|nr:hypothetical protein [Thiohalophilus sp.]MDZ7663638.1 hypothetical protein [Thiohalophilus sp.]